MKILILHPNFPAQFKHLSKGLADKGHEVKFLCQTHYGRSIDKVDRVTLKNKSGHEELKNLNLAIFDKSQKMGLQYRDGFVELKKNGWNPEIIICHTGWGCGLYAREIWPKAKILSYLEWWFDPESDFFHYDKNNKMLNIGEKMIPKCWRRNQQVALELSASDEIIAPTMWQKSQLPNIFRQRCHVIFDGIDLNVFKPENQKRRENIITYGTRGMDPMRCFPQLIYEIVEIIKKNKNVQVEIAGNDEVFYGAYPKDSTWGNWAKKLLKAENLESRVRWVGQLPIGTYEKWLKSSSCHIYTTHPFVASWSLVEAYCCGINIVGSDVDAVREICNPRTAVSLCDHRVHGKIAEAVLEFLSDKPPCRPPGWWSEARGLDRYTIATSLEAWGDVAGVDLTTLD